MRNIIDTEHVSIRETSPGKRVIQTHVGTYYLNFPYIQYYFYKDKPELMVSATKKPFSTKESNELFQVPTFNVNESGFVCQPLFFNEDGTLNQLKTIELFWNTSFGKDLPPIGYYLFSNCPARTNIAKSSKDYYNHWQKNGWISIPFSASFELFPHDPNYYKSPEAYFEENRLVCFTNGTCAIIKRKRMERLSRELENLVEKNGVFAESNGCDFFKKFCDVRITVPNMNLSDFEKEIANKSINSHRKKQLFFRQTQLCVT